MELTRDSLKAFKIIFCQYKERRKDGLPKSDAMEFPDGEIEKLPAFSEWLKPDIKTALDELRSAKYLRADILGKYTITDSGLRFMENQPKAFFNDISKLFDMAKLFI